MLCSTRQLDLFIYYLFFSIPFVGAFAFGQADRTSAFQARSPSRHHCLPRRVHRKIMPRPSLPSFRSSLSKEWQRNGRSCNISSLLAIPDLKGDGEKDGTNEMELSSEDTNKRNTSTARAGGRSSKSVTERALKQEIKQLSASTSWLDSLSNTAKKMLPLLAVLLILKLFLGSLFGGSGGGTPSFVYYQSSVYESRSYSEDGRMERVRKESTMRSNIPSLTNGREENKLLESRDGQLNKNDKDENRFRSEIKDVETFDRDLEKMFYSVW